MRKYVTFHLVFYLCCHSIPIGKTIGEGPAARVLKPCQFSIISLLKLSSHLLFLVPPPNHFSRPQKKENFPSEKNNNKTTTIKNPDTLQSIICNMKCENGHYSLSGQGQCFLSVALTSKSDWEMNTLLVLQLNTFKSHQL